MIVIMHNLWIFKFWTAKHISCSWQAKFERHVSLATKYRDSHKVARQLKKYFSPCMFLALCTLLLTCSPCLWTISSYSHLSFEPMLASFLFVLMLCTHSQNQLLITSDYLVAMATHWIVASDQMPLCHDLII